MKRLLMHFIVESRYNKFGYNVQKDNMGKNGTGHYFHITTLIKFCQAKRHITIRIFHRAVNMKSRSTDFVREVKS